MLAYFIFDAALGVASVISGETVAASSARQWMEQVFALGQLAEPEIEDTGAMAVHQHNPQQGNGPEKVSQRLEMKVATHKHLRSRKIRRQIVLLPDILRSASKHGLGVSAIAA